MLDADAPAPRPLASEESASDLPLPVRVRNYRIGRILALVGDALIIITFFLPWIEVFKIAPGFSPARHAYSPWAVLEQAHMDALGVATVAFSLLMLGLLVATGILASRPPMLLRADAVAAVALALAFIGFLAVLLILGAVPMSLSFNYPYYDTNIMYGGWLALLGFFSALVGSLFLSGLPERERPFER